MTADDTPAPLPPMLRLTDDFAAAPQPGAEHMAALAAAGFRTVICNRPDYEVPAGERAADLAAAARAAGLGFAEVAVDHGPISRAMLEAERKALADLPGPHFAYCAAGVRAALIWALASAGQRPSTEIVDAMGRAGLMMPGLARQIEALAGTR